MGRPQDDDHGPPWQVRTLPPDRDYMAPDGSEIRQLVARDRANVAHFRLPAGATSLAVAHRTIEEFWYVTSGQGQIWLRSGAEPQDVAEQVVELAPGVSLAIAPGTHFQFRATGQEPLEVVGFAAPPWPGPDEAYRVADKWPVPSSPHPDEDDDHRAGDDGATNGDHPLAHKPTVEGRLVTLRPFEEHDIEPAWEMVNDPVGNDLTATEDRFSFQQIQQWYRTRNDQLDRLDLAVVENATGRFAGEVVLSEYDTAAGSCSFRISLRGPGWYGRGLGTEATALVVQYGMETVGLERITLEVLARNPRARRTYEKVGFVVTYELDEDGERWLHMAIGSRPG